MSKLSKTSAPDLPTGQFNISGGPSANYNNGQTSYQLNGSQQKAYDYAQNAFAEGMQNVNTFLPETVSRLYDQVEAYKANSMATLNDLYTPMLRNTQNDAARRFGNLDNSVFLDNYGNVEKKRGNAMAQLAQNVTATQQSLYNQELQNQYNYLNFLNGYQNQVFGNAMQAAGMANTAANMQDKFAYEQFNAQNKANAIDFEKLITAAAMATPQGRAAVVGGQVAKKLLS